MAYRDTSLISLEFPNGYSSTPGAFNACIVDGPTVSGIRRGMAQSHCATTTPSSDGNIWITKSPGKIIDPGNMSTTVLFDLTSDDELLFIEQAAGTFRFLYPLTGTETTGPILSWSGFVTESGLNNSAISDGEDARLTMPLTIELSGAPTYTAPVTP